MTLNNREQHQVLKDQEIIRGLKRLARLLFQKPDITFDPKYLANGIDKIIVV